MAATETPSLSARAAAVSRRALLVCLALELACSTERGHRSTPEITPSNGVTRGERSDDCPTREDCEAYANHDSYLREAHIARTPAVPWSRRAAAGRATTPSPRADVARCLATLKRSAVRCTLQADSVESASSCLEDGERVRRPSPSGSERPSRKLCARAFERVAELTVEITSVDMFVGQCLREQSLAAVRCALRADANEAARICIRDDTGPTSGGAGERPSRAECADVGHRLVEDLVASPATAENLWGEKLAEMIDVCVEEMTLSVMQCVAAVRTMEEAQECKAQERQRRPAVDPCTASSAAGASLSRAGRPSQ